MLETCRPSRVRVVYEVVELSVPVLALRMNWRGREGVSNLRQRPYTHGAVNIVKALGKE